MTDGNVYTVKKGDCFYHIANWLGVPLRDLLEANADVNPARLMVGDVLRIPTRNAEDHEGSGEHGKTSD